MKITVNSGIEIEDPDKEVTRWCMANLILDNPQYAKNERLGYSNYNTPRQIQLYEVVGNTYRLPFGCLDNLWQKYKDYVPFKSEIKPIEHFSYRSNIKPYPYQENAIKRAITVKNGIIVAPCGGGKGLPIDAKICTPSGWKRNGDLQIGDAVVGSDGKATRVTGIFDRGKVDAYKITFSDGVETVCDKDHLWTVQKQSQRAESGNWFVDNTENIYKHYQNMKCRSQYLYIPIVEPVEFHGYEDYRSMNPWLLGFLLGDGCFQKSMITMSTSEDDIREKVVDIIGKDYGSCEFIIHKKNYDWRFCGGYTLHDVKSLGLECKHSYEKFIPKEYLFAPVEVRLAVLQGLFDADGHINNGNTFEYCTTSKQLADDVVFIVESLGGTAKMKEKIPTYTYNGEKRTGRKAYRIFFKLYKFKPFTSKKHFIAYRERTHYNKAYRIIKKIEPCDPITSRCITVDAEDQLYVTEHFVVTHNTQIALQIIARIGGRALWLTHTQELLNQSMARAKALFDCDGYGTITSGKINIGEGLTFATVQTMAKIDLEKYKDVWNVIVVDECQHLSGSPTQLTQYYKVMSSLSARYKYGLTATPYRGDGLTKAMFALVGNTIYTITKEDVADTTCQVKVRRIDTGYEPLDLSSVLNADGTLDYHALVADLTNNDARYLTILHEINSLDGPTIVLANRVEYLNRLKNAYEGKAVCLSGLTASKRNKEMRKKALSDLQTGEIDCIFATYSLAAEGLDCPGLRYVVFATPEKDERIITQSVGRVARKCEGKEYGTVIDFVDCFGLFKGYAAKRKTIYKNLDCEVLE